LIFKSEISLLGR